MLLPLKKNLTTEPEGRVLAVTASILNPPAKSRVQIRSLVVNCLPREAGLVLQTWNRETPVEGAGTDGMGLLGNGTGAGIGTGIGAGTGEGAGAGSGAGAGESAALRIKASQQFVYRLPPPCQNQ